MKKSVAIVLALLLIGVSGASWFFYTRQNEQIHDTLANLHLVKEELSTTKQELLGYTKYTDYLVATKTAMTEQMKFLAAKVDREYNLVEHIQKSKLGIPSEATIILKYSVEYSFGYDLKPESFNISGDKNGITITLNKPEVVASPAVKMHSHEIASKGVFVDEKEAIIELQQKLSGVAQVQAKEIQKEEAVIALCEKKLVEFLRDFMMKQPNVVFVPAIRIAYK